MGVIINKERGWTEAIIDDNCEFTTFYRCVDILKKDFGIEFSSEMDGLDSLYWDFDYKESKLSLHYNIYTGISIFLVAFVKASFIDNENVIEIGKLLFEKIKEE